MRKVLGLALTVAALQLLHAPETRAAGAGQCGLPDQQPWWVEFSDGSVSFRNEVFAHQGVIVATQGGPTVPKRLRAGGAQTVFWQMRLGDLVGTTSKPADPASVPAAAERLFARAADATLCSTPVIALNELFGPGTTTPWTSTNAQYRANVLALVQALAAKGARPFLLLPSAPYTGGTAGDWWRQVAQYSDLVPEVYFSGPTIYRQGAILGSRTMRRALRQSIRNFTSLGIPASRLGFVLGFQSSPGGRQGLPPATAWYQVVKWEALAGKQVASERGIASVWSWGWATFSQDKSGDGEKKVAACVYLWARDSSLCDGPTAAGPGFEDSLTEGQIDALPAGAQCVYGDLSITTRSLDRLTQVTGDREVAYTALLQRLIEERQAPVSPADAVAAERTTIALAYHGSLDTYLGALARARAPRDVARALLADNVRRARIQASLGAPPASGPALQALYTSYPQTLVRSVEVDATPWWLGARNIGYAVQAVAPARVFTVPTGVPTRIWTSSGLVTVTANAEPEPIGGLPFALARPALRTALRWFAQADSFDRWTIARQTDALAGTVCRQDDLPEVGSVDLSPTLPFLGLAL